MDETSIISKLETSCSSGLHPLVSDYLQPFTQLQNPKKTKKSTKSQDQQTLLRSLAKKFLPFINRTLSLLPKRLAGFSKLDDEFTLELFDIYRLCLDCLDSLSSVLSGTPYSFNLQRVRMVTCLEACGRYKDAESEGFRVLESLKAIEFGSNTRVKSDRRFVPDVEKGSGDKDLGSLVGGIVVTLVRCAGMNQSKDSEVYRRVLCLVEEVMPWFRVLDANTYEKLHRMLVSSLSKCTQFLVGELSSFEGDLVKMFCLVTMTEYAKSSMKDQIFKFAHRICSSLFLFQKDRCLLIDILFCLLDSLVRECKVEVENTGKEFVELIAYCAKKCRTTNTNLCSIIGSHLNELAGDFHQVRTPFHLILRLYASGLHFFDRSMKSKAGGGAIRILHDDGDAMNRLSDLLGLLRSYFQIGHNEDTVLSNLQLISKSAASMSQLQRDRKDYILSYFNALKFLCQPLTELVNSGKKEILTDNEAASVSTELCDIQGAFHQFYDVFVFFQTCTYEVDRDVFDDRDIFDDNSIISVALASFTLSIRTKLNIQKSVQILENVITSDWIQPNGLKHLYVSLYNTGVLFYRNKELKEASEALKFCCKASWTCVICVCDMFVHKVKVPQVDLSEDAIVDFFDECCKRSAFLLDVLNQLQSHDVKRTILESFENWSIAANLFQRLPGPLSLVKQWVKMECKHYKNVDVEDDAPTLYSLLSSSKKVTKKTIEIVLEQELLAYEEMNDVNPEFCQKMQMKIIDILLQYVHVTPDSCLQKSRILLRKGRALRLSGISGLKGCIQCLSDAISSLNEMYDETYIHEISPCHQLAVAYCLRALCTQEAEPNSKQVLEDISSAINLWLGISTRNNCSPDDKCSMVSESIMLLLYNAIDLLSIKGCMDFHNDIHRLMIRLFKWRDVPLEKCVARLWECRRISHGLCASPVNEAFIMNLSDHCGENSKSIEFWVDCLKESKPLLLAFQYNLSSVSPNFPRGSCNYESSFRSDITIDEVKEAAFELISSVPVLSSSAYIAGYLYYDLCERLVSNGRLIEALSYAKEAYQLRAKLFREKFMYSSEQSKTCNEAGGSGEKLTYHIQDMHMHISVASEFWSFDASLCDLERCYLSPWNVLQCYLESTLQIGVIHEIIGNRAGAEGFLQLGKAISCSQSLPLFIIVFSTVLGKLYHKQQLWDFAEKELQSAKQYLRASSTDISCLKCRLMLEATVNQNLGDLFQSMFYNTRNTSLDKLSLAENLYKSAIAKLNLSEWKNSVSCPEQGWVESTRLRKTILKDVGSCASSTFTHSEENQEDIGKPTREGLKGKKEVKKCKKTNNAPKPVVKDQDAIPEYNLRSTRSRYQSSQNQSISGNGVVQVGHSKQLKGNSKSDCPDTFRKREFLLDLKSCEVAFGCDVTCICNKMSCWQCLPVEVLDSGLVKNLVDLKWEFVRRRLSLRLLTGLGKCLESRGQIQETHEITLQTVSILVSRNAFCLITSSVSSTSFLNLMGKEIPGDVFSVERAEVLLNISWLSLKSYCSKETRIICSDLPRIELPKLVSWLMLAFVLCRDVPVLFQKVSRLLAAIFLLSASSERFSLSSSSKTLCENHWASYFHQASLGTHLSYQFFTNVSDICNVQHLVNAEVTGSTCMGSGKKKLLRLAPESIQELEEFVTIFFAGLPCTTIICISLLAGPYVSLLEELFPVPSCVHAWILVSRLNSESQPIVMLLPVDSVLEGSAEDSDDVANSGSGSFSERKDTGKRWHCPWGFTVVDKVAPEFRLILEESFSSASLIFEEDTKNAWTFWWMWRQKLDLRLGKLLKNLEDSWFGPWRCVLLGEWSNCKQLDLVHKKLVRDLKSKCKVDIDESLLKVILGGSKCAFEGGAYVSQLCFKKGCYIGKAGCSGEEKCLTSPDESNGIEKESELAFQLIHEAVNELEGLCSVNREPIILVLDFEVQMLPWENLPILRNKEVYRMPSIGSISSTLEKNYHHQDQVANNITAFPLIDPLDSFYLLNPSGDLGTTQIEFEKWFRDQNLEGKAGCAPPAEELAVALKSHDLFIYFGHGSGVQYIPMHQIQRLENCAATLLMGCSSGSLKLNGCYIPHGPPLSYLLAGSPVIVANLWEVTDKDINRFAKAMLDGWLKERWSPSEGCVQCKVAEEFEAMSIRGRKGNAKKKISKKKLPEACESSDPPIKISCDHKPKIGSFMSQAREACSLPFLTGASPVCYGVPTGIRKKDL